MRLRASSVAAGDPRGQLDLLVAGEPGPLGDRPHGAGAESGRRRSDTAVAFMVSSSIDSTARTPDGPALVGDGSRGMRFGRYRVDAPARGEGSGNVGSRGGHVVRGF